LGCGIEGAEGAAGAAEEEILGMINVSVGRIAEEFVAFTAMIDAGFVTGKAKSPIGGIGLNNSRAAKSIYHLSSRGRCEVHPATESSVPFGLAKRTGLSGTLRMVLLKGTKVFCE